MFREVLTSRSLVLLCGLLGVAPATVSVRAGDWPTYRADAARTGYAAEELPTELSLAWSYKSSAEPRPAWPTRTRQRFDVAYQPVHQASLPSELGNRLAALKTADGTRLWDVAARYVARPILNDRTIYAEPGAWDLLTGQALPFTLQRSYGCGIPAGSRNLLVFRSATLGYIDLTRGQQTENYGGIRPGCWLNAIPAGGLVLMADAASWCTCSYLNQATIALAPPR